MRFFALHQVRPATFGRYCMLTDVHLTLILCGALSKSMHGAYGTVVVRRRCVAAIYLLSAAMYCGHGIY